MAIEISSAASVRQLTVVKNSGQVAKPAVASAPEKGGELSPPGGKGVPAEVADSANIEKTVSEINEIVRNVQRDLAFNVDKESGRTVIRVIDSESGELIRQIPSEDLLALATHLRDFQENVVSGKEIGQGLLFSDSI